MDRTSRITACITFAALLAASPALSWGPQGHRVAGRLTADGLATAAAAAVKGILGGESLAEASTWADRMRSDPAPFWQERAGAWHYVNVPPGARAYDPGRAPAAGDAYTALGGFRRELMDPSTAPERRALALRFALHIIQDLHQPLHVGCRDDRGGNGFNVRFDGRSSNLHRLWDSGLLAASGRSDGAWEQRLRRAYGAELAGPWQEPDPRRWIAESLALCRQIYPRDRELGEAYARRHLPELERRLAQAGARGAAWLNAVYATAPSPVEPAAGWWQRLKQFLEEVIQ